MDNLEELFNMVRNDKDIRRAFLSSLNTLAQIATGDEEELEKVKQKYESWDELDSAGEMIDRAIEKNELFQRYLEIASNAAKTVVRKSIIGII